MNMWRFVLIFLAFFATTNAFKDPARRDYVPFIYGGQEVDIEDVPHQVSLQLQDYGHICGGSIVAQDAVLTAAHCVYETGWGSSSFLVRAGSSYHYEGGSRHGVNEIIQHPQYNARTNDYDFAIIKITPPFNLGSMGIDVIKIADVEPPKNMRLFVSGWGNTETGLPDSLMGVTVEAVSRRICRRKYSQRGYRITKRMICAAAPGKDACQGDSGGPLIDYRDKILYGVVSSGFGCADPRYPGIYSNVAGQRNWIKQHICG